VSAQNAEQHWHFHSIVLYCFYEKETKMKDTKTTINDAKAMVQKFCLDRNWDQFHTPKELAIGIASEAGELLQHFRFKSNAQSHDLLNTKKGALIKEELADVFYFILRFAQLNNIDLADELEKKIAKNAIKYPIEKARNSNKKYDED